MPNERILSVPFSYVVKHVPKNKRKPIEYSILEDAKVSIPDLTSVEAPTALRFMPKDWRIETKPADHPWWRGRLWEPWSRVASGGTERAMTVDELIAALESTKHGDTSYYSPFRASPRKPYNAEFTTLDALPPGRTRDSGEAERSDNLTKIAHGAAEVVFIDGKVYVPACEPVYMIDWGSGWGSGRNTADPLVFLKTIRADEVSARRTPDTYWRVDRLDEALAELAESENRRRTNHGHQELSLADIIDQCVWNKVEILMPECLQFRYDMRPRVDEAAEAAFEGMKEGLAEANLNYFRTYAGFRTLMRAEPRDHEAIVAALKGDVADALRPDRGHLAERMDGVINEWVNRDDPASIADADLAGLTTP